MNESAEERLDPSFILNVGFGFWPSKVLLSAVELEVFTLLGERELNGKEIEVKLSIHPRATWDFLDALVSLGFLDRDGNGQDAYYRNSKLAAEFLDKNKSSYLGGILEMANERLYPYWANLTSALKTGMPQNESKYGERNIFDVLYSDKVKLEQFLRAMAAISTPNFYNFAEKFDFSGYKTLCDVGGALGTLSIIVAKAHPHLACTSFDLAVVESLAKKEIKSFGLQDRIRVFSGDFFKGPLPKADIITMGLVLHDWDLKRKMDLIQAAYEALPKGGAFVAIENIIDDERRVNSFGLMMSLNMLVEFGDAFDFTGQDFDRWCRQVGFLSTEIIPLGGPASAAVAYK